MCAEFGSIPEIVSDLPTFAGLALAACSVACGASPATWAAERGDFAALHDAVAERQTAGDLSPGEAVTLAKIVADHELRFASGPDASDRIRSARSCARELDGALASRMRAHDSAGAEAALARLDAGLGSLDDARAFVSDPNSDWRAVATRALVLREDGEARRRALVDPEPNVRRQAARAARDARDAADLTVLADVARIDPEPMVSTEAVRAIAALPASPDGAVADALADLWGSRDEALREDIALAWSNSAIWDHGGRDRLYMVVASEHGPPAIEAAAAVLRRRDADAEVTRTAIEALDRAIRGGSIGTRLQALAEAPLDRSELITAVREARSSDDAMVRVGALARLNEVVELRSASDVEQLEALARAGSNVVERARFALAMSGDRRIQAWVEQGLRADRPEARLAAATELGAMGRSARAAPLLADGDPAVRLRAACAMILAARH